MTSVSQASVPGDGSPWLPPWAERALHGITDTQRTGLKEEGLSALADCTLAAQSPRLDSCPSIPGPDAPSWTPLLSQDPHWTISRDPPTRPPHGDHLIKTALELTPFLSLSRGNPFPESQPPSSYFIGQRDTMSAFLSQSQVGKECLFRGPPGGWDRAPQGSDLGAFKLGFRHGKGLMFPRG